MDTVPELITERESLNLRLEEISDEIKQQAQTYLIKELRALKVLFPESNFVAAFEPLPDMFVIQVNDLTTYHDPSFKQESYRILREFRETFKGETLIFITPVEGDTIEEPFFKI